MGSAGSIPPFRCTRRGWKIRSASPATIRENGWRSGWPRIPANEGTRRMKATIYHNPNCGTSRNTLAILQETPGVEVKVVEYLKNPPARETLKALYERAGITPRDGLRVRGTPAEDLGLTDPNVGDEIGRAHV